MAWLDELRTGFFRRRAVAVVVVVGVAAVDNFCQIRDETGSNIFSRLSSIKVLIYS